MWIWLILIVIAAFIAYVRLAPSDPARWHRDVAGEQDANFEGGALRIVEADLSKLDHVIRASRGGVLAGSIDDGHITYISRSRIIGFPDYTTVQRRGGSLAIYGRLRFGRSDLSVNRTRIERWIAQL